MITYMTDIITELGLTQLFIFYGFLAILVILVANKASSIVDDIDNNTNVGGALIGGVLLAGVTSLPEFIASLTAAVSNQPGLAFGNIFGSNVFNIVILGVVNLIFIKKAFLSNINKNNRNANYLLLIVYFVILLPMTFYLFLTDGNPIRLNFIHFGLISIFIVAIYYINIKYNPDDGKGASEKTASPSFSLKKSIVQFVLLSVALVIVAVYITLVTGEIAVKGNLGQSFAGSLFLGVATSLPELTAVYTLVKLNNYDAAVANIVGSNLFNLVVLAIVDFVTFKENMFYTLFTDASIYENAYILVVIGAINGAILAIMFKIKEDMHIIYRVVPSVLLIGNYVLYLVLSV